MHFLIFKNIFMLLTISEKNYYKYCGSSSSSALRWSNKNFECKSPLCGFLHNFKETERTHVWIICMQKRLKIGRNFGVKLLVGLFYLVCSQSQHEVTTPKRSNASSSVVSAKCDSNKSFSFFLKMKCVRNSAVSQIDIHVFAVLPSI